MRWFTSELPATRSGHRDSNLQYEQIRSEINRISNLELYRVRSLSLLLCFVADTVSANAQKIARLVCCVI